MGTKFKTNWNRWKRPEVNKIGGLLIMVAGIVTTAAGFGAWKNPHLDWEGFQQAFFQLFSSFANEIIRIFYDPFAFIGLIVMIVGIAFTINGIKRLFLSK